MIASHASWLRGIKASATQKSFKVLDPASLDEQVYEIDISILQDSAGDSSAEQPGWVVDVRYHNSPSTILFMESYPTEDLATRVMEDLSKASAAVEGFIKQGDFEGAKTAMGGLADLFKSTSGEIPLADTSGGTPQ